MQDIRKSTLHKVLQQHKYNSYHTELLQEMLATALENGRIFC